MDIENKYFPSDLKDFIKYCISNVINEFSSGAIDSGEFTESMKIITSSCNLYKRGMMTDAETMYMAANAENNAILNNPNREGAKNDR